MSSAENLSDRFAGSLVGLALGDALCAPYEGGVLERSVWWALGLGAAGVLRYSDDGEMALGCCESLVSQAGFDVEHMAVLWATRARWTRGYGPGALKVLKLIRQGVPWQQANTRIHRAGSYGNGAAMRVAPLALMLHREPARMDAAVRLSASVTHAHELGIQGAIVVARGVAGSLQGRAGHALLAFVREGTLDETYHSQIARAAEFLETSPSATEVARELGNGIAAHQSVGTALYVAARYAEQPFEDLIAFVRQLGGDVDTIAAMSAAMWGARRGLSALPTDLLQRLEHRERFETAALQLAGLASR